MQTPSPEALRVTRASPGPHGVTVRNTEPKLPAGMLHVQVPTRLSRSEALEQEGLCDCNRNEVRAEPRQGKPCRHRAGAGRAAGPGDTHTRLGQHGGDPVLHWGTDHSPRRVCGSGNALGTTAGRGAGEAPAWSLHPTEQGQAAPQGCSAFTRGTSRDSAACSCSIFKPTPISPPNWCFFSPRFMSVTTTSFRGIPAGTESTSVLI